MLYWTQMADDPNGQWWTSDAPGLKSPPSYTLNPEFMLGSIMTDVQIWQSHN